jgi:hypothetical protein
MEFSPILFLSLLSMKNAYIVRIMSVWNSFFGLAFLYDISTFVFMIKTNISLLYWLIPWILFLFLNRIFVVTQQKTLLTVVRHEIIKIWEHYVYQPDD